MDRLYAPPSNPRLDGQRIYTSMPKYPSFIHRPALGWTVKESVSRAMMINRKCIWSLLLPIVNIEEMKRKILLLLLVPLQSYPFNPCNPCSIKNLRITFYQTNSAFSDNNPCNPCSRTYASSHIKAPQYSQRILSVKSVLSVFKNPYASRL